MAARIATAVLALVACSRTSAPDPTAVVASAPRRDPAAASAPAAPDPAPAPVAAREPASARALAAEPGSASAARTPAPSGEARRSTIPRLEADAQLLPHLATLRDHFGATARGPFEVQHVDLADGRAAVLVSRADESDPIVLAYDRDVLLWSKLRPTAGIVAPVKHVTLLPGPEGGAAVFAWVASLHMVAARTWADDGNPFGDFELFAPDGCDALSAAYGPGQGWVVACTSPQGTRAQRLREDCSIAWGKDGVAARIDERLGAGHDRVRLGVVDPALRAGRRGRGRAAPRVPLRPRRAAPLADPRRPRGRRGARRGPTRRSTRRERRSRTRRSPLRHCRQGRRPRLRSERRRRGPLPLSDGARLRDRETGRRGGGEVSGFNRRT